MPRELALMAFASAWQVALGRLALASAALLAVTFAEWRKMAHQWWDIDTYNHILLLPAILAWLLWLRRDQLAQTAPRGWWPGLLWLGAGMLLWLGGRAADINLVAQGGVIVAFQGAIAALLGVRVALVAAFPLGYALLLVPFGDELIPLLQQVTARIAVAMTHASGIPAVVDGLYIDTPGGKFVVAEECSGVKFLVAMTALSILVAWTGFTSWKKRVALVAGAGLVSILANGVRAWGTIFAAQYVGEERAGGLDHIVYGWVFFAIVMAAVLAVSWRHFERESGEAGLTAEEAAVHPLVRFEAHGIGPDVALAIVAGVAILFAALAALV
ncbi:exosortase A [Tsuneonella sp. HG249]